MSELVGKEGIYDTVKAMKLTDIMLPLFHKLIEAGKQENLSDSDWSVLEAMSYQALGYEFSARRMRGLRRHLSPPEG